MLLLAALGSRSPLAGLRRCMVRVFQAALLVEHLRLLIALLLAGRADEKNDGEEAENSGEFHGKMALVEPVLAPPAP